VSRDESEAALRVGEESRRYSSRSHMDIDSGVPASTRTTSFRCLL
jgi:hypothetical protein